MYLGMWEKRRGFIPIYECSPLLSQYHNGLFHKKTNRGTPKSSKQNKSHSQKFHKIVRHPTEILRPKIRPLDIPNYFFLITYGNSTMLFISSRKIQLLFIFMSSTLPFPPQPLLVSFFFGIVQYRCMNLPKTSDMIEHIKMIQIPTLS